MSSQVTKNSRKLFELVSVSIDNEANCFATGASVCIEEVGSCRQL